MSLCNDYVDANDLAQCGCPDTDKVTLDRAITSASEIMYRKLGLQFPGTCEAVVRPCGTPGPALSSWGYPWTPMRWGGEWINTGPCGCLRSNDCGCKPYPKVNLGRDDIQSIEAVVIDTTTLDPSAYRLDQHKYLIRQDGSGWPCCQNLGLPIDTEGTWYIELTYGNPVPQAVKDATAALATEFVKACEGTTGCRLPRKVQNVVKQGVSFIVLDDLTALPDVMSVINTFNPNGLIGPAKVFSPDLPRAKWS